MARFSHNDVLFGRYRIERFLARGGFAEVYLATHLHLNAPRALKVLVRGNRITTGVVNKIAQRFRLEAQLGARFADEPHIVRVYDLEWDREQGLLVLVTEYLPGGSLKDRIRRARKQGLPGLPVDEVVHTAYHVALGLAALHRAELVHRDIKPSNILYDARGRAKIADLGIVQIPHGLSRRTEMGETASRHPGTPEYMSPEQERTVAYLPPASDIYSLGATLFEALTLRHYKHLKPGTRLRALRPEVPPWLDDLLARMLAKDPETRPWDGAELTRLLAPHVAEGPRPRVRAPGEIWPGRQLSKKGERGLIQEMAKAIKIRRGRRSAAPAVRPRSERRVLEWRTVTRPLAAAALLALLAVGMLLLGGRRILPLSAPFRTAMSRPNITNPTLVPPTVTSRTVEPQKAMVSSPSFTPSPLATVPPTSTPTPRWPIPVGTPLPSLKLITPENAARLDLLRPLEGHTKEVLSVAFSPDGQMLASGAWDNTVRIWDVETGTLVRTLQGHMNWVESVAFSPDGQMLASGSWDNTVRLWEVETGETVYTRIGATYSVLSVAFSPNGKFFAAGAGDGTVRLWEVATGDLVRTWNGYTMAFSPDSRILAVASSDRTVRLWEVGTGALVRTLRRTGGYLTFAPDGQILAVCSNKTVQLWDVETGTLMRTLEGHTETVGSVAFSPDGRLLASGWGNEVLLWDVDTGALVRTLEGHTETVQSVAFSPDGRLLASGSNDHTVRLWGVP